MIEVRGAVEDLVTTMSVDACNLTGLRASVPPRVVAQSVPGLAHTHEPTRDASVPGCMFCARQGNALAAALELGAPAQRDAIARFQMPLLDSIAATYDALLDMVAERGLGGVEAVRRDVVAPMRAFLRLWSEALAESPGAAAEPADAQIDEDGWDVHDSEVFERLLEV